MSLLLISPETKTYKAASISTIQKQQYQAITPVEHKDLNKQVSEIVITCLEKKVNARVCSRNESICSKSSTIHSLQLSDIESHSQLVKASSAVPTNSFSPKESQQKGRALSDCSESSSSSSDSETDKRENPKVEYVSHAKAFPPLEYDPETGTEQERAKVLEEFNSEFQDKDYSYFLQNQEKLERQIIRVTSNQEFNKIIYVPVLEKLLSLIWKKIKAVPQRKSTQNNIHSLVGRIERLLGESCTKQQENKQQKATNFLNKKKQQDLKMDNID